MACKAAFVRREARGTQENPERSSPHQATFRQELPPGSTRKSCGAPRPEPPDAFHLEQSSSQLLGSSEQNEYLSARAVPMWFGRPANRAHPLFPVSNAHDAPSQPSARCTRTAQTFWTRSPLPAHRSGVCRSPPFHAGKQFFPRGCWQIHLAKRPPHVPTVRTSKHRKEPGTIESSPPE